MNQPLKIMPINLSDIYRPNKLLQFDYFKGNLNMCIYDPFTLVYVD